MCCKEGCGIWVGERCLIKLLLVSVWGASQHPEGFGPLMLSHREPLFIHTDLGKTQQGCFRMNKQGIMINLSLVRAESPCAAFSKLNGQFKLKILALFIHPHVVPNLYDKKRYFEDCTGHCFSYNYNSKLPCTFKVFICTIFQVFWRHTIALCEKQTEIEVINHWNIQSRMLTKEVVAFEWWTNQ